MFDKSYRQTMGLIQLEDAQKGKAGESKRTSKKTSSRARGSHNAKCQLCQSGKLNFAPPVFYCNGNWCNNARIKRNRRYWHTKDNKYHFCTKVRTSARMLLAISFSVLVLFFCCVCVCCFLSHLVLPHTSSPRHACRSPCLLSSSISATAKWSPESRSQESRSTRRWQR